MSAYDELSRTGAAGDETIAVLRRLGRQYTRTHSFPPPAGYRSWTDDAVDDLLADMFAAKGPAFVLTCWTNASDDASLERLLLTTIGNSLKDAAKSTERGKLRRRLSALLGADPRFARTMAGITGWRLVHQTPTAATTPVEDLVAAAYAVRGVAITRWNTAGPTPAGTRHALIVVAEAVLGAANGVVRDEDLAAVIEARFALLRPPRFVALHSDPPPPEPFDPDDDPALLVTVTERAEELWSSMTQMERSLLPHLGPSDSDLATIAGTGPGQARAIADAIAAKLRAASIDDAQHKEVILELLALCHNRP